MDCCCAGAAPRAGETELGSQGSLAVEAEPLVGNARSVGGATGAFQGSLVAPETEGVQSSPSQH